MSTVSPAPILAFVVVILLILKQPVLKVPFASNFFKNRRGLSSVKIDYGMAPIIGVFILLATSSINEETVVRGIVGTDTIRPYSILILFMALAYLCISLDLKGFFAYLALVATKAAGDSGKRLFLYFFLLTSFLTVFTSNDIVILTMTPIIYYFAKNTKTDPIPFLLAQFFAANIWSIALYIGNPTNIIVAQAYNLSFLEYSRWMILPTIFAGTSCLALLWLIFRKRIPDRIENPNRDPESALVDRDGAVFGTINLVACLIMLSLSSWLVVPIWAIPLFFAFVVFASDSLPHHVTRKRENASADPMGSKSALKRMPWKIAPFVTGLFIMVESLSVSGWVDVFASSLSKVSGDLPTAVLVMGFASSFASNLMNNQPMTILFTRILQSSAFTVTPEVQRGAMFALVLGSNFGANFTLIGALAGIMWAKMLYDKGVTVSFKEFSKYGFLIMPVVVALACLALVIQLMVSP